MEKRIRRKRAPEGLGETLRKLVPRNQGVLRGRAACEQGPQCGPQPNRRPPPERVFGSFLHGQKGTRRRRETEAARRTGIILPRPAVQTLKNEIVRKTGISA